MNQWWRKFWLALTGQQRIRPCTGMHLHAGQRLTVVVDNPGGFEIEVTGTVDVIKGDRSSENARRIVLVEAVYE